MKKVSASGWMRRLFQTAGKNRASCPLPEQAVIIKGGLQPAGVLPPREVGAHRTANERVLLKIHHEVKAPEQLLQPVQRQSLAALCGA